MQWLIDLIIATIGIPPVFINRGDPNIWDWQKVTFTTDNAWHDLALSGIVPVNASAILFHSRVVAAVGSAYVLFKMSGQTFYANRSVMRTDLAGIGHAADFILPYNGSDIIVYKASTVVWTQINLIVKGWWL